MEKKALALKEMMKTHVPKRKNLDPRKWMTQVPVKAFADLALNKQPEDKMDNSFDNKEMCEYTRNANSGISEQRATNFS